MLKTIPLLLETMQCPINKPQRRLHVPENGKTENNDENFQKPENANFVKKKIAKICDNQKLKPIPSRLKKFQSLIMQPLMMFPGPWDSNNLNNDNKCQKIGKKLQVLSKNSKTHDGKTMKTIPLPLETMQ